MRSAELDLKKYDSDKIENLYLKTYDPFFEPFLEKKIALLELGIYKGGSLQLWRDYFPFGTIAGIDVKLPEAFQDTDRIHVFEGSQADHRFLTGVANEIAPQGFDIIIDDASHLGKLTKIAFWHLFDHHLKPGGMYVIEDWGTGYWDDWPDGKSFDMGAYSPRGLTRGLAQNQLWIKISRRLLPKRSWPCHSHGMVGLVKQLVDEQGAADVTRKNLRGKPERASKFENMVITPSLVFIKKANHLPL
jgi:hypothetical protein